MNFLTPEQEMWRATVERFIDEEIGRDYIRKCDREREYPYEAYEKVAKQGWLGILFSEESGGLGGDIMDYALMCDALAKYGFDFATGLMVATFTAMNIEKFGTPEQKERYIQPFLDGDIRFSISISEPGAGSDAASTKTRARRDGDGWSIAPPAWPRPRHSARAKSRWQNSMPPRPCRPSRAMACRSSAVIPCCPKRIWNGISAKGCKAPSVAGPRRFSAR